MFHLPLLKSIIFFQINYVALELGLESARCAILHWTGGGGDAVPPPVCQQMNPPRPTDDQDPSDWQFIDVNSTAKSVIC